MTTLLGLASCIGGLITYIHKTYFNPTPIIHHGGYKCIKLLACFSIPVTLLRWDDYSTRPVRFKAQYRRLYVLSEAGSVKHRHLPNTGLVLRLTKLKDSITKFGPTRDSNPGSPDVQSYMIATTPPTQLLVVPILSDEMRQSTVLLLLAVFIAYTHSAPQFISFNDGKLGVNFGGYHAGVGIGGLLGGSGGAGGLYAEAGTPHGQSARAGLGGGVSENGGAAGGLYAGATAGGKIKASAGLAGGVGAEHSGGVGYASAQAGNNYAATGMGGESSLGGSSEFSFTGTKNIVIPVHSVEVKPTEKKIHAEFNVDAFNEVQPLARAPKVETEVKTHIEKKIVHENVQPVVVKEVYVQPQTKVVEKEVIRTHYKPRRHHFRKTAFVGGYVGGQGDIGAPVVYKTVEPQIEKRIDVAASSSVNAGAGAAVEGHVNGGVNSGHVYTKHVTYQKSPSFFEDIFNIPISTLKAVGSFLGNTAANTNISVQKSATVQAESESKSLKHDPSSSSVSSSAHVSVETPTASKFIEDIFAIPINTLGAVNQFLQNNVGRKTVQVETGVLTKEE
ncbi:unnamed protein product, partial [Brenthis ino]